MNNLAEKYQIGKDVKNVNNNKNSNDQNTGNKSESNNNNNQSINIDKITSMKDHIDKFCLAEQI